MRKERWGKKSCFGLRPRTHAMDYLSSLGLSQTVPIILNPFLILGGSHLLNLHHMSNYQQIAIGDNKTAISFVADLTGELAIVPLSTLMAIARTFKMGKLEQVKENHIIAIHQAKNIDEYVTVLEEELNFHKTMNLISMYDPNMVILEQGDQGSREAMLKEFEATNMEALSGYAKERRQNIFQQLLIGARDSTARVEVLHLDDSYADGVHYVCKVDECTEYLTVKVSSTSDDGTGTIYLLNRGQVVLHMIEQTVFDITDADAV